MLQSYAAQGEVGKVFAREGHKRARIAKQYGRKPGARSVYRCEKELERDGCIVRRRLLPGADLPRHKVFGVWRSGWTRKGVVEIEILSRQRQRALQRDRLKQGRRRPSPPKRDEPRPHRVPDWTPPSPPAEVVTPEQVAADLARQPWWKPPRGPAPPTQGQ